MTNDKNHADCIVYAYVRRDSHKEGAHALPSSMDRYDTEFGWTADDFDRASGGYWVYEFDVSISAFSIATRKNTCIATRLRKLPETAVYKATAQEKQDIVIFHKANDFLFDVGKYGTMVTLGSTVPVQKGGAQVYASPCTSDVIEGYDDKGVYIVHDGKRLFLDLQNAPEAVALVEAKSRPLEEITAGYFSHEEIPFTVDGRTFRVVPYKEHCAFPDTLAQVVDEERKEVFHLEDPCAHIIAAVGFKDVFSK
jgi:hypothetical protein